MEGSKKIKKIAKLKSVFALIVLLLAATLFISPKISAQNPQPRKAINLEPFLQQIVIDPAEKQKNFSVKVTNYTAANYTFQPIAVDFGTLDETGGVLFAGTDAPALVKKYGLANWLTFDKTTKTLAPGQSITINALIDNRDDLAPGGHYAAIILSSTSGTLSPANQPRVSFQSNISGLIFAKKTGGDVYNLNLIEAKHNASLLKLPSSVTLRFKNQGNTHIVPRGVVSVIGPGNKLVSRAVINENSQIILPETIRRFDIPLKTVEVAKIPGKYKLIVDYRFDGFEDFRGYQASFFLATPLGLIIVGIIVLVLAGFGYFVRKRQWKIKKILKIPKIKRLGTKNIGKKASGSFEVIGPRNNKELEKKAMATDRIKKRAKKASKPVAKKTSK